MLEVGQEQDVEGYGDTFHAPHHFTAIATVTLLVYDYILTLKLEKRLVWPSRLSTMKAVFLLNRYLPFVGMGGVAYVMMSTVANRSIHVCKSVFFFFGSLIFLGYVIAEFILYARAYAVWERKRSVGILLLIVLLSVYGVGTRYFVFFFRSLEAIETPLSHTGCSFRFRDRAGWASYVVLIFSETFAVVALLARHPYLGHSKMMRKLSADGIAYYIFILISSVVNVLIVKWTSGSSCYIFIGLQGVLHSIFCSRLLLNIRGAYEAVPAAVCSAGGGAETQVLDTIGTISAFSEVSGLSDDDVDLAYEANNQDEGH